MINQLRMYVAEVLISFILKIVPDNKDGMRLYEYIRDYSEEVMNDIKEDE